MAATFSFRLLINIRFSAMQGVPAPQAAGTRADHVPEAM
jgi:hypothetical protein